MGAALTLIPLFLVAYGLWHLIQHLRLRRCLSLIPSPRSFPIIGHAPIVKPKVEDFVDQLMGMAQLFPKAPRAVLFWNLTQPILMIYDATLTEQLFMKGPHSEKGMLYDMLKPWLGEGLLTSKPDVWKARRRLLTPTFHYDILKNFIHVFNDQSAILVQKLHRSIENDDVIADISKPISLCALDIICETSMGQSINAQSNAESDYVRAVLRINDIIQNRQKNPLYYNDFTFNWFGEGKEHNWALNVLHSFTRKVIRDRRESLISAAATANERPAFLDLLLEMEREGQLDEKSIQEEVDTFMFEGHDTTSTAGTWAMHIFGCYPEVQERAYEEIHRVCGDASSEITAEHLSQLKYLECCIKEIARLYPSVPLIARRLGAPMEVNGQLVPKGTEILVNIYLIHRDPEYWVDAERFDPERFLPENQRGRHAFAFIPFSAGSRNCIGQRFAMMEEKIMLVWLLRAFRIESIRRRDEQTVKPELLLRANSGVSVRLIPRQ